MPKTLQAQVSKPSANPEVNQAVFNGDIKHVEAEKAIKFLESLSYDDFTPFEIRETPKQKEIIALEKMSDWKHYNGLFSIKDKNFKKNRIKLLTK